MLNPPVAEEATGVRMCSKFTCRGWHQYAGEWCLVQQVLCRRFATCRGPCWGRIEAPAQHPFPSCTFSKGACLICCCLTFNGKSLHLLRHGNTISAGRGKGGCREATWASSQAAIFSSAFLLQAGMCLGACIVVAGPKVGIYSCSTKTREILGNSSPMP